MSSIKILYHCSDICRFSLDAFHIYIYIFFFGGDLYKSVAFCSMDCHFTKTKIYFR